MPTTYCRHIKTNGRRCLSPAMRGKALCYFHHKANESHRSLTLPPPRPEVDTILHPMTLDPDGQQREPLLFTPSPTTPANASLSLPTLEDHESIQLALSVALNALAGNRIDTKRAYTLLFGLHVASRNAANLRLGEEFVVRSVTTNKDGAELAPNEDPIEIQHTNAIMEELEDEEYEDDGYEEDDDEEDGDDDGQDATR